MNADKAHIAVNRFGMGARPGEINHVGSDPRNWLRSQISPTMPLDSRFAALQPSHKIVKEMLVLRDEKKRVNKALKLLPVFRKTYIKELQARLDHSIHTPNGFQDRLVRFWSNHFTIAAGKFQTFGLVGAYEREAIRPHINGSFETMLLAVMRHPAMLFYLDNVQSLGPNSKAGKRRKKGLNENLAREALELHTVGVDGGYVQKDVEELAKALTGWTVNTFKIQPGKQGEFAFVPRMHEPGKRTVLGNTYKEVGESQARDIFKSLAREKATARHIATKLARHFIADIPPKSAIDKLTKVFLKTGGQLSAVYDVLIDMDEAWQPSPGKFKTPEEMIISAFRGLAMSVPEYRVLKKTYESLGQAPFRAQSPQGWPDRAEDWSGPNALQKRIEWAQALAAQTQSISPTDFLDTALGPAKIQKTRLAVSRAESREQGLVLALMSPEFQRR